MPYPNEHACRIKDPADFQDGSFRSIRLKSKKHGKSFRAIIGKLKGETTTTIQAYRYDKDEWSTAEAREHCKSVGGRFEAAKET